MDLSSNPTAEALDRLLKRAEPELVEDFTKPQAVFSIDVVDPTTGKRYVGTFRSKAPTIADRDLIGLVMAQRAGGVPWESVPRHTRVHLEMFATFEVLLLARPKDGWFNNPAEFYSEDVPAAVYSKIMRHWECFFRSGPDQGRSEGEAGQSRGVSAPVEG